MGRGYAVRGLLLSGAARLVPRGGKAVTCGETGAVCTDLLRMNTRGQTCGPCGFVYKHKGPGKCSMDLMHKYVLVCNFL